MYQKYTLFALIAISAFLWSEETSSLHKKYITPDQVTVTASGILVFLDGNIQPAIPKQPEESAFRLRENIENRRS